MSIREYNSGPTSNDLLERRVAENASAALRDLAGAQGAEDMSNIDDASAVGTET
jgi:hypothetical protein